MKRNIVRGRWLAAALIIGAICAATAAAAGLAPPSATSLPSVSGSARDGSTFTTSDGRWRNSPTSFTYSWLRCDSAGANCATIAGANSKQYTETTADVGHRLRSEVSATNSSGSTSATSNPTSVVAAVGTAPHNTAAPSISGNAQEGQTLSAGSGGWSGVQPISYTYQWSRCDGAGASCGGITGATGQTYNTTSADVAHTLRVTVKASNSKGSSTATSGQTAVIAPATSGGAAISVTTVVKPDQLVVDNVKFSPQPLGSRRALTGRFHVSDTRGFSVQGALVFALGLPYGWVRNSPEVATDGGGWATVTFSPTARMPLSPGTELVVFVRVRKPGDSLLAGVSNRRLVQARIR
ncbi:MAG: hypothetical protein ABUS54_09245 [Actinomycetota bacterium]